ncbi:HxlR family transcriptional regulator [Chitinophaga niastensis]|uniref:HxlR family transcriptional regulator n=1 Tax=Chitinophaga niastensis TaxID=536980 RepID=A0A2P8HF56_CHINA|nr:helix-turn-helix domain-containing protein [Chitinophaga niastensis]PSL44857.1 HxlR family transcriptional regulator [Chitinophaga niastensis]
MRKENSTNALNERKLHIDCGIAHTLSLISGRWKASILWRLQDTKLRYNELKKAIEGISERVLVLQLRELENDNLVKRVIYPEVPPRVEYELTPLGLSMVAMLRHISDWGILHLKEAAKKETAAAIPEKTTIAVKPIKKAAVLAIAR